MASYMDATPVGAMADDAADNTRYRPAANEIRSAALSVRMWLVQNENAWYNAPTEASLRDAVSTLFEERVEPMLRRAFAAQPAYRQELSTDLQTAQIEAIEYSIENERTLAGFPSAMLGNLANLLVSVIPPHTADPGDGALASTVEALVRANISAVRVHYATEFGYVRDLLAVFAAVLDLGGEEDLGKKIATITRAIDVSMLDDSWVVKREMERLSSQRMERRHEKWAWLPGTPSNFAGVTPGDGDCFYSSLAILKGWGNSMEASRRMRRFVINYMRASRVPGDPLLRYGRRWKWRRTLDADDELGRPPYSVPPPPAGINATPERVAQRAAELDRVYDMWLNDHSKAKLDDPRDYPKWANTEIIAAAAYALNWRINIYTYMRTTDPSLGFHRYDSAVGAQGPLNAERFVGVLHVATGNYSVTGVTEGRLDAMKGNMHFVPILKASSARGGMKGDPVAGGPHLGDEVLPLHPLESEKLMPPIGYGGVALPSGALPPIWNTPLPRRPPVTLTDPDRTAGGSGRAVGLDAKGQRVPSTSGGSTPPPPPPPDPSDMSMDAQRARAAAAAAARFAQRGKGKAPTPAAPPPTSQRPRFVPPPDAFEEERANILRNMLPRGGSSSNRPSAPSTEDADTQEAIRRSLNPNDSNASNPALSEYEQYLLRNAEDPSDFYS